MKIFETSLSPKKNDEDEYGHISNVVFVRWIQEVALAHWKNVSPPSFLEKYAWFVIRHEINYHAQAFAEDVLLGKTWITKFEGAKCKRRVDIFRQLDNTLLSSSETTFCLLNAESKRPLRIPEEIMTLF